MPFLWTQRNFNECVHGRSNTHNTRANQWPKKKDNFHSTMQDITFMNWILTKFWQSHFVVKFRQIKKSPTCRHNYIIIYCGTWTNSHFHLGFIHTPSLVLSKCLYYMWGFCLPVFALYGCPFCCMTLWSLVKSSCFVSVCQLVVAEMFCLRLSDRHGCWTVTLLLTS